jgi:hypothetical protein
MADERFEVQRSIAAEPAEVFAVLRDPRGHVAIDASGSLMSSTGEPVNAVGDRFVVHMDREAINDIQLGLYDVTIEIITYVPDEEIAWNVQGLDHPPIGHYYGYRLEPIDGGTRVTQYYDWSGISDDFKATGLFPVISESSLRATLGILARTVAPGKPRPDA